MLRYLRIQGKSKPKMCLLPCLYKNSQGRAMFQWECVDENSKRAKDAIYRKDRGEIPRKMSNVTRKICALSFAYSSALVNRPKKEME